MVGYVGREDWSWAGTARGRGSGGSAVGGEQAGGVGAALVDVGVIVRVDGFAVLPEDGRSFRGTGRRGGSERRRVVGPGGVAVGAQAWFGLVHVQDDVGGEVVVAGGGAVAAREVIVLLIGVAVKPGAIIGVSQGVVPGGEICGGWFVAAAGDLFDVLNSTAPSGTPTAEAACSAWSASVRAWVGVRSLPQMSPPGHCEQLLSLTIRYT